MAPNAPTPDTTQCSKRTNVPFHACIFWHPKVTINRLPHRRAAGHTNQHNAAFGHSDGPRLHQPLEQRHPTDHPALCRCVTCGYNLQANPAIDQRPEPHQQLGRQRRHAQNQFDRKRPRRSESTTPSGLMSVSFSNASNSAAKRSASPSATCIRS